MAPYNNSADNSTTPELDPKAYPIIAAHYDFAQEATADALAKRRTVPEGSDFTDRPPPGAPAAAKPKPMPAIDIVSTHRAERRAAVPRLPACSRWPPLSP